MASYGRSLDRVGLKPARKAHDHCVLNDDDVIHLLRAAVEREGSQSAFARRYRVQRTELNAILNGRKRVTTPFAKAVGLRIHRVYVVDRKREISEGRNRVKSFRRKRSG